MLISKQPQIPVISNSHGANIEIIANKKPHNHINYTWSPLLEDLVKIN